MRGHSSRLTRLLFIPVLPGQQLEEPQACPAIAKCLECLTSNSFLYSLCSIEPQTAEDLTNYLNINISVLRRSYSGRVVGGQVA